ncbi:E3 ubiquitin-protein ligase NRDP1-like [Trichoplusia ni]|uniref:E3 ubiquitin-protein ligase NRDP1-like n=1 Tax=Trichoplusia ni TaxID=7111 RepID=A0A7E5WYA6_TRINI|nr:E3 ubiquitin-protein ligase NRDP1-like [Trichoplusia ni]
MKNSFVLFVQGFRDPLQAPACEHAFCRACITEWISRQPTCPVDRQAVTASQLRPVPRILRNLLSRLCTSCDNALHGCNTVLKLDSLASHLVECMFMFLYNIQLSFKHFYIKIKLIRN